MREPSKEILQVRALNKLNRLGAAERARGVVTVSGGITRRLSRARAPGCTPSSSCPAASPAKIEAAADTGPSRAARGNEHQAIERARELGERNLVFVPVRRRRAGGGRGTAGMELSSRRESRRGGDPHRRGGLISSMAVASRR
jgi:hypothetical protein